MKTPSTEAGAAEGTRALFEELPEGGRGTAEVDKAQAQAAAPRLLEPNRRQVELRASDLESLLGEDHRARLVWGYVERQDLSALLEAIKARGSNPGRAAIDPRILFALWLYAVLDGVGSGREVERLCRTHDAYRWICGGVEVNYHALNDFRSGNEALMDRLLTDNVAALAAAGAISLERVAQDGMRVRASAGAASFHRRASLQEHLGEAGELVQTLKAQAAGDPGAGRRRAQAARLRAAQEREQRIRAALEELQEVEQVKKRNGGKAEEARASTTDPQARVMKMGDAGYRPAVNVQFATTTAEQVIVGTDVVNVGSDMGQLAPMVKQVEQRVGCSPREWLADGGFAAHEQIDAVAGRTAVYAPVPEPKTVKDKQDKAGAGASAKAAAEQPSAPAECPSPPAAKPDKHARKAGDSDAVAQWRERMGSEQAKEIYKQRAATAECVNALARNRGLVRLPVRGLSKIRSVVGLFVLAHNLLRTAVLAPDLIGWGQGASAKAAMAA